MSAVSLTPLTVTRWWLIRHAPVHNPDAVICGSSDREADTGNRAAAAALAASLPADALWLTSPLRRSRQTAQALWSRNPRLAGTAVVEPALAEQDFGDWEGISHDTAALRDPEAAARFWRDPARHAPPNGESFAMVMERTADALRRLTDLHAGRDLVAVIHAGSIRGALALALDLTPEAALRLRIDPWSLSRIDHHHAGTGAWSVGGVNLQCGTF
ncbi:phosphoglycerate mutase [Azospirillum sp. TSH100]|uniref:histidine phosphatase family protein n=1 Tax=Azospirillum sp. TSH100 TaxID=652764 RepID=UPI000D60E455|nr:histidine phosphatase family protein [Azospirillum sp. TSH100]PWC82753.1 phosphoglycerate mutase [Azospirillum sp. TSH100]QCG86604.1 histidine phosphatase family protein [Azospirillum sp. TSH100]